MSGPAFPNPLFELGNGFYEGVLVCFQSFPKQITPSFLENVVLLKYFFVTERRGNLFF
jgi:hypothetical protein